MKIGELIIQWTMSNIIKKLNKFFILPLSILVIFSSCNNEEKTNHIDITFKDSTITEAEKFKFYKAQNGALYLDINNLDVIDEIKSKIVDKVVFSINDTIYNSTIVKEYFPSKIVNTKFFIYSDNKSGKIIIDSIEGKEMFFVGWSSDIKIPKELLINDNPN
ncbi:hypothetical protein FVB9532_00769 [Mesonia oceanica]|uniref:Uncharacterized protein n=1 Tax=Mesonia oceanica TaxID=2687242 RepID=A0AC61Y4U7_9FLAO|nr:hypothetical protein FVB9532_00769 [Mesonia oceanica]